MKNAIVIGELSGVGKGIAKALADREFNVIIGAVNNRYGIHRLPP